MGRIAAAAIAAIIGFRGLPAPESEQAIMGPLANYSLPVVLGMLVLGLIGGVAIVRSAFVPEIGRARSPGGRVPLHMPLLLLFFLTYLVSYLVSRGVAADMSPRTNEVLSELIVGLVFTHLVYLAFRTRADLESLRWGLIAAGTGIALFLLYRSVVAPDPQIRLGTFQTANYAHLSYAVVIAAWMGPVAAYLGGHSWRWAIGMPHLGVVIGACLLTGTRAGIWSLLLLVPLFVLLRHGREHARGWIWFLVASLATVWALIGLLSSRAVVSRGLDILVFNRGELWGHALGESFEDLRSFFFGTGIGSYDLHGAFYPHNLILDAWHSAGIFAAFILVGLVAALGLNAYRLAQSGEQGWSRSLSDTATSLTGLGLVSIIGGLVTYSLPSNLFLWIFVGAASRLHQIDREATDAAVSSRTPLEVLTPVIGWRSLPADTVRRVTGDGSASHPPSARPRRRLRGI